MTSEEKKIIEQAADAWAPFFRSQMNRQSVAASFDGERSPSPDSTGGIVIDLNDPRLDEP